MNRKLKFVLVAFVCFPMIVLFLLSAPFLLQKLPSRYLLYLPEPIQALGQRENIKILPTPDQLSNLTIEQLILETKPTPISPPTIPPVVISTPAEQTTSENILITRSISPTATVQPTVTPMPTEAYPSEILLSGIKHQFQGWNNCGPATIAMTLSYFGSDILQEDAAEWLKPNPEDRNVSPHEIVSYVENQTELAALTFVNGDINLIKKIISAGYPVMIETGIDPPDEYRWMDWYGHYYLVIGYSDLRKSVQVYDSWLGAAADEDGDRINLTEGRTIGYEDFDTHWRQFNRQIILVYEKQNQAEVETLLGQTRLDPSIMWESTLEITLEELEAEPENAYLWFNLGTTYSNLEEFELAAAAFDKSREIGLPWRMLWYQFEPFKSYLEVGRYQDVIDLADSTLYQRPYFEESYYYRGLAYIEQDQQQLGINDLQRAITFNPRFQLAQNSLSKLKNQE